MVDYDSTATYEAATVPGVTFTVRKMSFARRLELLRPLRDLAGALERARAGDAESDQVDAAICEAEIERLLLEWGLASIEGLHVDGAPADVKTMIAAGPLELGREIAMRVREQTFLDEGTRKN